MLFFVFVYIGQLGKGTSGETQRCGTEDKGAQTTKRPYKYKKTADISNVDDGVGVRGVCVCVCVCVQVIVCVCMCTVEMNGIQTKRHEEAGNLEIQQEQLAQASIFSVRPIDFS